MRLVAAALLATVGCFGPSLPTAIECSTSGLCPDGLTCRDGACVEPGAPPEVDAGATFDCSEWNARYFDPCALPAPVNFEIEGETTIDTDAPLPSAVVVALADGTEVMVLSIARLAIGDAARLRAIGSRPLVLAVFAGPGQIDGVIDVSSIAGVPGAGANPAACAAADGTVIEDVGCGGAGGGHGTAGGSGGDCIANVGNEVSGPAGGAALEVSGPAGGCSGGGGGRGASGGAGGGAIHISVNGALHVGGSLLASGAGGAGTSVNGGGGGGGGAGGYLGLEATEVILGSSAVLVANGGGGGGSSRNNESGVDGDAGAVSTEPAPGGNGYTEGGAGGALADIPAPGGSPGIFSIGPGGGGGGAAGRIEMIGAVEGPGLVISPAAAVE